MCRNLSIQASCVLGVLAIATFMASYAPASNEIQPAAPVSELVAGNNTFALDLYADLTKTRAKDNLVFSPYSVSLALAMAYGGAGGETANEMKRVLHFAMPGDELHRAFAALQARQKAVFAPKGYELNVANSLWGQKGFPFHASYFELTREKYGADLEEIDFRADPEIARQRINAWVGQRTKNKITDLVRKGTIDNDTRLVLANAVYLKGAWAKQFSRILTRQDLFQVDADTKTPILMMSQHGRFRYFEDADLQAVDLPIGIGGVSMWILLPKQKDGLAKLEKSLTNQRLQKLRTQMNDETVTVELPKFRIESELNLTNSLSKLGMPSAFALDKADFSKMAAKPGIVLKAVAYKAYLNLDETGLEAAAATAIVGKEGAPPPKFVFRADHPFFYLIRESSSGSMLFIGRLHKPVPTKDR
jgi:serpin B